MTCSLLGHQDEGFAETRNSCPSQWNFTHHKGGTRQIILLRLSLQTVPEM